MKRWVVNEIWFFFYIVRISNSKHNFFVLVGKFYVKVCEACHITLNKIVIFGDNGTIDPGGVRVGE